MPISNKSITPKLYERAFKLIAHEIDSGILAVGERLTEVSLANRLGISRAPIRQAIAKLEQRGFVERASSSGYQVAAHHRAVPNTEKAPTQFRESLGRIQRASWELIYDDVEKAIVSRTAFDNCHVNEVALAKHYGVSRTVSRDVLARLQHRGILTKDDKGRWFAPVLSEKRLNELYEVRSILEPIALGKAATHFPDGLVMSFRERLNAFIGQKKLDDYPTKLDALEQDIHVKLLSYCDNQALLDAIHLPQTLLVTQHFLYDWTNDMFDSEPFLPEHMAVYDFLIDDDVQSAAAALGEHLRVSSDRSIRRLQNIASRLKLDELPYINLG